MICFERSLYRLLFLLDLIMHNSFYMRIIAITGGNPAKPHALIAAEMVFLNNLHNIYSLHAVYKLNTVICAFMLAFYIFQMYNLQEKFHWNYY